MQGITLPTKVRLVKAMVFPVVMYGCESWTVKKAERRRIDAFERGARRATVHGVVKSRTQLKRLSTSTNGFSVTWGRGILLGIMNVLGFVPNSSKKKPQGYIQLIEAA